MAAVRVLIGASPFDLDDRAAAYLVEWIRGLCQNEEGLPIDVGCAETLTFADEVERGEEDPIELGQSVISVLHAYVLRDYLVHGDTTMEALFAAVCRFLDQPG